MRMFLAATAMLASGLTCSAHAEYVAVSDDLTIHYQTAGQGKQTILLVPGWTMSGEVFSKQLEHFKDSKDYRVITFDPRSQGQTTKTLEGNYYEQHGRDLDAFIRKLDLNNIVLGGWSNAGFDVLSYVHQFGSQRLKALVMIDAAPTGSVDDNTKQWGWFRKDDADGFARYFTQGALNDRVKLNDEFAHWMVTSATPDYIAWVTRVGNETSNGVAALLNTSSTYQDYATDLSGLEGKVQLLYITHPDWKDVVQTWAKQHTPSATVTVMDKHMSFWETPEQFDKPLDALLAKLSQ